MLGQILRGTFNELTNREEELYKSRISICNLCKLKKRISILGVETSICDDDLYLNPITNDVSSENKKGYFKGCACRIEASTRVKNKKCPVGKW